MVFKCPQGGLPAQLENEMRMLQMTHIASRPNAVTTAEILNAIAHIAEAASERMNQYLPVIHLTAKHEAFHNWPQRMLVCEDEKLSLRGFGQIFGTCQVGAAETLPSIGIPAIKEIIYFGSIDHGSGDFGAQEFGAKPKEILAHHEDRVQQFAGENQEIKILRFDGCRGSGYRLESLQVDQALLFHRPKKNETKHLNSVCALVTCLLQLRDVTSAAPPGQSQSP